MSHSQVRGAVFGLALFLSTTGSTQATELHELVQRLFGEQSYVLVEYHSQPPRLLLIGETELEADTGDNTRQIQQALLDLADRDPATREDALLALADLDNRLVTDLVASALADSSADVRDTAASILEDMSGE
ncbi:MAG: hypothetical protein KJO82_08190 [Gammaproteobacteria bacterium]|nr:hypothetical protein [Gammaproteobacteria bacterium]